MTLCEDISIHLSLYRITACLFVARNVTVTHLVMMNNVIVSPVQRLVSSSLRAVCQAPIRRTIHQIFVICASGMRKGNQSVPLLRRNNTVAIQEHSGNLVN